MINAKQKMELRAKANSIKNKYILGKKEISDEFIDVINKALDAKELIKVSILKTFEDSVDKAAQEISFETKSEVVQVIGRVIILFRKKKEQ